MKTTTKLFAIAAMVVASFSSFSASAQQDMSLVEENEMGWRLGIGLNGGLFEKKSTMDYAYGADVRLQYDIAKSISLTATVGYTRIVPESNLLNDIELVPAKGGVKVFPIAGMYLAGEAGAGIPIQTGGKLNFVYSGGTGYSFRGGFDISARYEGYVNDVASTTYFRRSGQFALRLAYGFKL